MPLLKDTLCVLAVVAAYGLAAYWDAYEEQEGVQAGATLPPDATATSDESPPHDPAPTPPGVQHAQR